MPVPTAAGDSVALDQFLMPQVKHDRNTYDCFVLAVDEFSGYCVVAPAMRKGFTGAKAAKMMISEWVGLLGVPGVIITDMGARFVGTWW